MDTSRKIQMTVTMEVTIPQALTLQAMFEYWNQLARFGSSRNVTFMADGDGSFHPNCQFTFSEKIPTLTDELRQIAVVRENGGDHKYDFDGVAWKCHEL